MSKLRLNGTSSGYVEITAPANAANNTITLPSDTGSIIVQSTTGITSFASAPVVIGTGTSTGTASQTLQVTGGAYVSGDVGIGSTIPANALDVVRSTESVIGIKNTGAGSAWVSFTPGSAGGAYLHNTTNSPMVFTTNGTEKLRIAANGDINMGSASNPGDTLRYFDIYNTNTGNSAGSILRLITNNSANSATTSADLTLYRVGDLYLRNYNTGSIIFGTNSATERGRFTSAGYFKASNTGTYYSSSGPYHEVVSNADDANFISQNTNASLQGALLFATASRAANSTYAFLRGYSSVTADLEINIRGDGNAYADGSWNGGGADYAEYFEWEDGNPDDEDRRGYSVSLIGDKIKIAEEGEQIIGVISGNPSVVGDAAWNKWSGKYLTDDFGSYIFEEHNVVEWTDEDGKQHSYEDWNLPEDVVVPEDAVIKTHDEKGNRFIHRKLNPEYDPDQEYISREERPEWDAVGMMGKLRLRKGQLTGPNWIKLKDISATVEEWLVR